MEGNDMMHRINAVGDRLLGLFVPSVTASADPCGREYYQFCYCSGTRYYRRHCCSNGGCGSCRYAGNQCV
jgi:hypothetical protein